ncbi:hypothetical protein ACIBSW_24785 [Actinoplanes sp. NPDC049668]|uniref:hypothetical protein n=1 Tax=unclassified Actinoplanes TaxID=2626549 RepID=UPI0033A4CA11
MAVGVVLAVAALAVLIVQPLGAADGYASVGSFLVSILAFGLGVHAYARGDGRRPPVDQSGRLATEPVAGVPGAQGTSAYSGIGSMMVGDDSEIVDRRESLPQPTVPPGELPDRDNVFVGINHLMRGNRNKLTIGSEGPDPDD